MKHNFNEKIKHPDFTGRIKKLKRNIHGRLARDKHNKVQHEEPQLRKKMYADPDFVAKHNQTTKKRTEDYADIFMPLKNNTCANKEMLSF